MTRALALCALGLLLLLAAPGSAQDAKQPAAKKKVYDQQADASKDIAAALAKAKKENRHVLIQWGGNSCVWCVLLHDKLTTDPKLRQKLQYEYDVVKVDVGSDKHQTLAKQYGAKLSDGIPYLTILDSAGKAISNQRTDPFETKSAAGVQGHDPQKLLAYLTENQAKPRVAEEVLQSALAEAEKSDRMVFLHFGAPWCGWCHRMEAWMALPEIAALLSKDFVDLKIDTDRMEGGKAVLARFNTTAQGGIPWFVFTDAKGKALATSNAEKGNIGFPYEDHEIAHFIKMLEGTKRRLTEKDLETLQASLKAGRKAKGS